MAKKKSEGLGADDIQEDLASVLASTLNAKFKETNQKIAYFLDKDADSPSNVTDWISTGNDIVDLSLAKTESNWKRKGFLEKIFTENSLLINLEDNIFAIFGSD